MPVTPPPQPLLVLNNLNQRMAGQAPVAHKQTVAQCAPCLRCPETRNHSFTPQTFYNHSPLGRWSYNRSFSGTDDTWLLGVNPCVPERAGLQRNGFRTGGATSAGSVGFVSFNGGNMINP